MAWLPPAVAMAPPAPPRYRKMLGGLSICRGFVRQSSVIVMRHLSHWPLRTASGILGMALAVAILVGSLWSFGSIDHMIDVTFHRSDRQDATINFTGRSRMRALYAARRLPGVLRAEPFRAVAVKIRHGPVGAAPVAHRQAGRCGTVPRADGDLRPVVLPRDGPGAVAGAGGDPEASAPATRSRSKCSKGGGRR